MGDDMKLLGIDPLHMAAIEAIQREMEVARVRSDAALDVYLDVADQLAIAEARALNASLRARGIVRGTLVHVTYEGSKVTETMMFLGVAKDYTPFSVCAPLRKTGKPGTRRVRIPPDATIERAEMEGDA